MVHWSPQAPSVVWVVLQVHPDDHRATEKTTGEKSVPGCSPRAVKATGDLSQAESDVEVVNTRYRAIRLGNTSKENAKNGIGLQTGKVMEEISIIP